jgi:hypothetical protein
MKGLFAVHFDHVQTVRQGDLQRHVATLDAGKLALVCQALAVAFGCR